MKKIILSIVLLGLINLNGYSQNIKNYSGKYSDAQYVGNAEYQYYENDNYERIFHGKFKFTTGEQNSTLSNRIYREINGNYNENWKDGIWVYKSKHEEIIGSYKMGLPNGEWTRKELDRNLNEMVIVEKANYINGKIIGDFYYNGDVGCSSGYITQAEIEGKINDNGYLDGEWIIKWDKIQDIRKYRDGILYFRLTRNIESGDILLKIDSTNFINEIYKNLNKSDMSSEINGTMNFIKESDKQRFYESKYNKGNMIEYKEIGRLEGKDIGSYSYYVKYDHLICILDNWKGAFYGIEKGEKKKLKNYYKRIVINYYDTEEGKAKMKEEKKKRLAEEEQKRIEEKIKRQDLTDNFNDLFSKTYSNDKMLDEEYYPNKNGNKRKKKIIFDSYRIIYNQITSTASRPSEENVKELETLHKLQEKMKILSQQKTKDLEESLNGMSDYKKILDILGNRN